jgi:hypothetical protein
MQVFCLLVVYQLQQCSNNAKDRAYTCHYQSSLHVFVICIWERQGRCVP